MGYLSNQTNGSRDAEIVELKTKLNGLQTAMVGMETMFPPTAVDGSIDPSWVPKNGQTLSRAAYPALWERVKNMGTYVTDTEWLALQSSSPNGAVSIYSSGDGSTTFRVPTVGPDGGFQRAIGTDPILNSLHNMQIGYLDQIQNIIGRFAAAASGFTNQPDRAEGAFELESTGAYTTGGGADSNTNSSGAVLFDASRVARTGDETHPKGMYGKVYIYSGNSTTSLPTPTVDWLAQQDANTAKIAELEIGKDWVVIGDAGAPAYENSLGAYTGYLGLRYRFVDAATIQVIGTISGTINSNMLAFTFPAEIAARCLTSQRAPATGSISTGTISDVNFETIVNTLGEFRIVENVSSGVASRMTVNHTVLLDV